MGTKPNKQGGGGVVEIDRQIQLRLPCTTETLQEVVTGAHPARQNYSNLQQAKSGAKSGMIVSNAEDNAYYEKNDRGFIVRGVRPIKGSKHAPQSGTTQKRSPGVQSPFPSNRDLEIELADHMHPLVNGYDLKLLDLLLFKILECLYVPIGEPSQVGHQQCDRIGLFERS